MEVKIIITKMSSEFKHIIDDIIPLLGAVSVTVEGAEDPPVVRIIELHARGNGKVLKERTANG